MENLKNKVEPIADLKSHNLKREEEIRANTKFLSSMVGAVFSKKNSNKKINSNTSNKSVPKENKDKSVEKTKNNEKKEKKK